MTGLHAANVWQTFDVGARGQDRLGGRWHRLRHCRRPGGGAGCFLLVGEEPGRGFAALVGVLGGVVGAWSASMVGISIPSPRLQRFEGAIAQG